MTKEFIYDPIPPREPKPDPSTAFHNRVHAQWLYKIQQEDLVIRSKRFHPEELAAEYWYQEGIANDKWESCYPYHNEASHRWPEYLQAIARTETIQRFVTLEDEHQRILWYAGTNSTDNTPTTKENIMASPIAFKNIKQGDTIQQSYTEYGMVKSREGVVVEMSTDGWVNDEGFYVAYCPEYAVEGTKYYLVHRPRVVLPTESGTIIMATVLLDGNGPIPMYLDYKRKWVKIPDGYNQDPENIEEWYLIDTDQKDEN